MRTQTASASAASVSPERITWARLTELRPSRVIQVPVRTRPGKFSSARKSMPRRAMTKNRFSGSVGSKRVRNRLTRPLLHKVANSALLMWPLASVSPKRSTSSVQTTRGSARRAWSSAGAMSDLLHPAPFRHEQRHRGGDALHRGEADALVEAVDVLRDRAVAQRRDAVVEGIDAGVEIGRRHEAFERPAGRRLVRLRKHALGVGTGLQHVAFGEEAVEGDPRRVVGEEPVLTGEGRHRLLDLARGIAGADARIDRDAAVEPAPGRHRGGPVAARDLADVEVDWMRVVGE